MICLIGLRNCVKLFEFYKKKKISWNSEIVRNCC